VSTDNVTSTARLSKSQRAGYKTSSDTVTYFEISVTQISRNAGGEVDNTPSPGTYESAELNMTSFENAKYTFTCQVKYDVYTSSTNYDYSWLYQLVRLERTKGLKLIYPSNTSDTVKTPVELMGAYNSVNGVFQGSGKPLAAGYPYISGRVSRVNSLDFDAKSKMLKFKIEFDCEEEVES
jgi:hypothetical protein